MSEVFKDCRCLLERFELQRGLPTQGLSDKASRFKRSQHLEREGEEQALKHQEMPTNSAWTALVWFLVPFPHVMGLLGFPHSTVNLTLKLNCVVELSEG